MCAYVASLHGEESTYIQIYKYTFGKKGISIVNKARIQKKNTFPNPLAAVEHALVHRQMKSYKHKQLNLTTIGQNVLQSSHSAAAAAAETIKCTKDTYLDVRNGFCHTSRSYNLQWQNNGSKCIHRGRSGRETAKKQTNKNLFAIAIVCAVRVVQVFTHRG